MKLLTFVSDVLRQRESQEAFARDPEAAMDAAGLTEDQKDLVRGRDRAQIALAVANEIAGPGPIVMAPWPSQSIKILSVSPAQGHRGSVVLLTVTGQWFTTGVTCKLLLGNKTINTNVTSVTTGETSSLTASVTLTNGTTLGRWDVKVATSATNYDILPGAFTVVA